MKALTKGTPLYRTEIFIDSVQYEVTKVERFTKTQIVLENGTRLKRFISVTSEGNTSFTTVGERSDTYKEKPDFFLYQNYLVEEKYRELNIQKNLLERYIRNKDKKNIDSVILSLSNLSYRLKIIEERDTDSLRELEALLFRTPYRVRNFNFEVSDKQLTWSLDITLEHEVLITIDYDSNSRFVYNINNKKIGMGLSYQPSKKEFDIDILKELKAIGWEAKNGKKG